jgi:hypothetical protein
MGKYVAGHRVSVSNSVLSEQLSEQIAQNNVLMESYSAVAQATLEFDEKGWSALNALNESHIQLRDIQTISRQARMQTNSNALLKRGAMLRASYIFGRGFEMSSNGGPIPPRYQKIVDDVINQQVLFSESACKKNERTLFTDGNFFAMYDNKTSRFSRIPLTQITAYALDPDDHEIVLYLRRSYSRTSVIDQSGSTLTGGELVDVWYPTDMADPGARTSKIDGHPVDRTKVIFHRKENDETGSVWGIPDCLPAMPWAWAYSEYLKDGSKMLKALSSIAWQIKSKTAKGVSNASAKVTNNRQVAATVVSGSDVEMASMPRSNAIDLDTGRPLAAMAATAMEVSVDALLSGSSGSGASGIQVLDQSTLNAAYGRQGNWEDYFTRILRFLGVRDVEVIFNKIIVDPAYRNVQSIGQAWQTGLFDPAVIQKAYAEELGFEAAGTIPVGVLIPNHTVAPTASAAGTSPGSDNVPAPEATNVATSQGNSGAGLGDITNGDNLNRDNANTPQ